MLCEPPSIFFIIKVWWDHLIGIHGPHRRDRAQPLIRITSAPLNHDAIVSKLVAGSAINDELPLLWPFGQ